MSSSATAGVNETQSPLIFLVDDEPLICELLNLALTQAGNRVRVFTDPMSALEAFEDADPKPDCLATDYTMPMFDGLELIRRCLNISPKVRTLLFSGNLKLEMLNFQAVVKPERFMHKPFVPGQFVEEVRSLLASPAP